MPHSSRARGSPRRRALALHAAVLAMLLAAAPAPRAQVQEAPDLVLEMRLGSHVLSDSVAAWQNGSDVLLPLGEMARLLTLAVKSDAASGQATGYILDEQRAFHLDLARQVVVRGSHSEHVDAADVRRAPDDLYVPLRLLSAWLPVDFSVDMASLVLTVKPREKLPLQSRLERQERMPGATGGAADPGFAHQVTPYRMASLPFIDQTLDLDLSGEHRSSAYTAYATGDLLGAQAALYVRTGQGARLTLGRHDPGANLLGPLRARSAQVGSVASPGVANITSGGTLGNGLVLSNRAIGQPARFDRHNLQGDLPPGWDVELYFNGALVGFQQSRADGRYSFDDQPLIYGANEFRLVFHGPLGQVRIERHTFLLEQSMLAPGQLDYTFSAQRDEHGGARTVAQVDYGLHRRLTLNATLARSPSFAGQHNYSQLGVQAFLDNLIVSAATASDGDGGTLGQVGVKTRIGRLAVAGTLSQLRNFDSELYPRLDDPLTRRSEVRIDGQLGMLPVSLHARQDRLASGASNDEASARMSAYRFRTAVSAALRWQSIAGVRQSEALLQMTRRVAGIGISGQLLYAIGPQPGLSTLALSADKHLGDSYLLSAGVTRSFIDPEYRFTAGMTKSLGRIGMGLNAFYSQRGAYGIGLQLFTAVGRDPLAGRVLVDAAPMAASGSAAARVFVDANNDGVMNGGEAAVPNAGFLINGGTQMVRTGADGVAYLGRLVPNQYADVAIDPATLEDPQWQPAVKGMRIVPRAGTVTELAFAVRLTADIDGTAYFGARGGSTPKKPAGDLEIELLDSAGKVVATTRTGADGYYVLPAIVPGRYLLQIAPQQLARLGLGKVPAQPVEIDPQANFVNGRDFVVTPD